MSLCLKKRVSIMVPSHNNESIHYGAESKEGKYPLWHCGTTRRASITTLSHKNKSIQYCAVSQEGENILWYFVTRIILLQKEVSIHYGTESQE